MNKNSFSKTEIIVCLALVLLIVVSRLMGHAWNFTVVGGVAIFAGAYFSQRYLAITTVVAGLLVSDAVIGFHNQMFEVYLAYALAVGVGYFLTLQSKRSVRLGASLFAAVLFFAITNFAVWYGGQLYPLTFDGLMQSYLMGLPFFRNQLAADVISTFALFELALAMKLPEFKTRRSQGTLN